MATAVLIVVMAISVTSFLSRCFFLCLLDVFKGDESGEIMTGIYARMMDSRDSPGRRDGTEMN